MSAVETESPPPADAAPSAPKSPLMLVLLAAGLSAAMASGSVWFITGRHPAEPAPAAAADEGKHAEGGHGEGAHAATPPPAKRGAAQYLSLTPAFTVNLAEPDSSHFLQVEMEVMSRDAASLEGVKQNLPQIRNAVLLMMGQLHVSDVSTRESKEALQKHVVEEIQKVLVAETGKPGIDSVFFTSFVVQ